LWKIRTLKVKRTADTEDKPEEKYDFG